MENVKALRLRKRRIIDRDDLTFYDLVSWSPDGENKVDCIYTRWREREIGCERDSELNKELSTKAGATIASIVPFHSLYGEIEKFYQIFADLIERRSVFVFLSL